jgi:hypothetical protein
MGVGQVVSHWPNLLACSSTRFTVGFLRRAKPRVTRTLALRSQVPRKSDEPRWKVDTGWPDAGSMATIGRCNSAPSGFQSHVAYSSLAYAR